MEIFKSHPYIPNWTMESIYLSQNQRDQSDGQTCSLDSAWGDAGVKHQNIGIGLKIFD